MIADRGIDQSWRFASADALDAQIVAVEEALDHLANVDALLDTRGEEGDALRVTRHLSALYRELRNGLRDESRELRAAGRE